MIQLNPRLRPSAKTIAKICFNKVKNSQENKNKRLASLNPFFDRTHTDPGLQACIEQLKAC
jgi:hypothetical protein